MTRSLARAPRLAALLAAAAIAASAGPSPDPAGPFRFRDAAAGAGLVHRTVNGAPGVKRLIIETVGTGVAVADFDGDGVEDLYFANGSTVEKTRAGRDPGGRLYLGRGDGTYRDATGGSGAAVPAWGAGAFAADVDNDGAPDLLLTGIGGLRLLANRGDGRFDDVTARAGLAGRLDWPLGAGFADADGDGLLDLYVAGYVAFDLDAPPNGGRPCSWMGLDVMCGPRGLDGAPDAFFRNRGDGTFEDATAGAGLADGKRLYGMGVAWFDADQDGRLDVYVANDSVPNLFYRQVAPGRFQDRSLVSGAAYNGAGTAQASMGIAIGDADGDGDDDLFTTNFARDTNTLHRNLGGGRFEDATDASGLGPPSFAWLGWGTAFEDLDNDGDLDLHVVNGHVYPEAEGKLDHASYAQPMLLFENLGDGRFRSAGESAGPGLATPFVGRGSAMLDADGDGRRDIVACELEGPPHLLLNESARTGHWLEVALHGTHCARDAVGARVTVEAGGRRLQRSRTYGEGYLSSGSPRLHFGLGPAAAARVAVRWPCGREQSLESPADRLITVREEPGPAPAPASRSSR